MQVSAVEDKGSRLLVEARMYRTSVGALVVDLRQLFQTSVAVAVPHREVGVVACYLQVVEVVRQEVGVLAGEDWQGKLVHG